ncbi:hypothetical protein WN48_04903 [Eufriesea mexicana]|uniref:Uncharacterized protein n=1 Tax=Eufriesea mexicana TaxID=516756 RepID=A0A310S9W2_9HYME|nr:hypothetical protein WN48_04903 [Eufriesea mexicana]
MTHQKCQIQGNNRLFLTRAATLRVYELRQTHRSRDFGRKHSAKNNLGLWAYGDSKKVD